MSWYALPIMKVTPLRHVYDYIRINLNRETMVVNFRPLYKDMSSGKVQNKLKVLEARYGFKFRKFNPKTLDGKFVVTLPEVSPFTPHERRVINKLKKDGWTVIAPQNVPVADVLDCDMVGPDQEV